MLQAGVRMHPHVDADHNFFVQVRGRKRWTLYPPAATEALHPFPRIHPLWHKSQLEHTSADVALPGDRARFPDTCAVAGGCGAGAAAATNSSAVPPRQPISATACGRGGSGGGGDVGGSAGTAACWALSAELGPGDVLYVPPYTWHSVLSLTPSISLSSWSDNANARMLMQHLYRAQPHEFDTLRRRRGRMFALRAYLETLLSGLYGPR